jgi:hypothetical protein
MEIDGVEFDDTGLLPKVSDEEVEWLRPDFASAENPIRAGVHWIQDILTQLDMAWPAERNGQLLVPPVQHILDRLVRSRIAGESPQTEAALILHPDPSTVAVVPSLPMCDFCALEHVERPARYDSTMTDSSGMAFMCAEHYLVRSPMRLGSARGQYLMTRDEVPEPVLEAFNLAMAYWGFTA